MNAIEISCSEALILRKDLVGGFYAPDKTPYKVWTIKECPHLLIEFKGKCYQATYTPELKELMEDIINPKEDKDGKDSNIADSYTKE